jgi:hypothetical protein
MFGSSSAALIQMLRRPHRQNPQRRTSKGQTRWNFRTWHVASARAYCILFASFFSLIYLYCIRLEKWSTWKNVDGQTTAIQNHLKVEHGKVWRELILLKQLKGWETIGASTQTAPGEREEFSIPGFYDRLVKWIAVDDQARL